MFRFTAGLVVLTSFLALTDLRPAHSEVLSISDTHQSARPGDVATFSGTITNDTGFALTELDLFLNFSGYGPLNLVPTQVLGGLPLSLADGATTPDIMLFDVSVDPAARPGLFPIDVQVSDTYGNSSDVVTVDIAVLAPSPGLSLTLGLLCACLLIRGRRATLWSGALALASFASVGSAFAETTPVHFALSAVGVSVWEDGTVSLAAPILNSGGQAGGAVTISNLTLPGGTRVDAMPLPRPIGDLAPGATRVVTARFTGLPVPSIRLLNITGTYVYAGQTYGFAVNRQLRLSRLRDGTAGVDTFSVMKNITPGYELQPVPIPPLDQAGVDRPGPPVPEGPLHHIFPVAPIGTAPQAAGTGQSVTFFTDTKTGEPQAYPPDPSVAPTPEGVVFATANTYASISMDGGKTFVTLDPTTVFPNADGGICCDQVPIYDPKTDLVFWLLQYNSVPANPPGMPKPGSNRLRVAWASPASIKSNNKDWRYIDLTPSLFENANSSLDYPDLAVTNKFLYISVDIDSGLLVARLPLSELSTPGFSVANVGGQFFVSGNAIFSRLVQNSPDGMYWAGHQDTSDMTLYSWPDEADAVTQRTSAINTWCRSDYSSLAPDGLQWFDNAKPSGTGSIGASARTVNTGKVWIAWGAARDDATCSNGRPQPHVLISIFDDYTLAPLGEYDIWNTPYAFAYPALGVSATGEVGVAVNFGGPSDFATFSVGFLGDYIVYYGERSSTSLVFYNRDAMGNPISTGRRFGDYFAVRQALGPNGINQDHLGSEGYSVLVNPSNNLGCLAAGTDNNCLLDLQYIEWGRNPNYKQ